MKLNCLIVDDDPTFRQLFVNMIKKSDENNEMDLHLVGTAAGVKEADEILRNQDVDLMFLDVMMPEVTGLEYLQELQDPPHVVLVTGDKNYAIDAFDIGVIDFLLKPFEQARFEKALKRVTDKIQYDEEQKVLSYEEVVLMKVLKYMHSRDIKELKPIMTNDNSLGFYYPVASDSFDATEQHKVLSVLNSGMERGYFTREFQEAVYLCYNCFNSFLLNREVCPNCDSSNLVSEDLVHHFPCAYVGPVSDFEDEDRADRLVCPKCGKSLKHIGVDYDKPSLIYFCRNCGDNFQDVVIKGKCVHCNTDMEIENLTKRNIYRYQITRGGMHTALKKYK